MKKQISVVILLVVLITSCLALTACHEHKYGMWKVVKQATCTEDGSRQGICLICAEKKSESIPATGHAFGEWITDIEPTHTQEGSKHRVCGSCGEEEIEVIASPDHVFGDWTVVTPATCTNEGLQERACECGEKETETIPVIPHTFGEWAVVEESTCTQKGQAERVCGCGEKETKDLELADHVYTSVVIPPTCTKMGYTAHTCVNCGHRYVDTYVDAIDHTFSEWTIVQQATCLEDGLKERTCQCGAKETEVIPAPGHTVVVDEAVSSTCEETGLTEGSHCSVCNETLVAQTVVSALGHDWNEGKVTVAATCIETGVMTYTCERDASHTKTEEIAIDGDAHNWGAWEVTTPATCTTVGIETRICSHNVSHVETREIAIDPDQHDLVSADAKNPTCTEIGWYAYETCSRCDYTTYVEIPATGHSYTTTPSYAWSDDYSACTATIPCDNNCGESKVVNATVSSNTTPATCTEKGSTTYTAIFAEQGYTTQTQVVEIDATGHNYENNVCTVCGDILNATSLIFELSDDETYYIVTGLKDDCEDTDIVIPSTYEGKPVTGICDQAFFGCSSITSITIPDSVTSIGLIACLCGPELTSINVDANNPNYQSIDGNLYSKDGKTLIQYAIGKTDTSFTIPSNVESLGDGAFYGCTSLEDITIPGSVMSIGYGAFLACTSLTSLTFEPGSQCTSIGSEAFRWCNSLEIITIPSSVTSIGYDAFYECYGPTEVQISDLASWCSIDFGNNNANPLSCGALLYLNGEVITELVIPEGVTSIGDYAFYDCYSLTSVTIPNSVTGIGDYAFYDCYDLTTVHYTGTEAQWNDISIGSYNDSLLNANIIFNFGQGEGGKPEQASIGLAYTLSEDGTYYIVTGMGSCADTDVVIPSTYEGKSVTSIGDWAFSGCTSLTSITIPEGVTSIGDHAFYNCTSLESITIPSSVTKIGDYAFHYCTNLEYYEYNNAYYLGNEDNNYVVLVKAKSTDIRYCDINSNTKFIYDYAFSGCTLLTSVTFEDGSQLTNIGSNAFYTCPSLTSITIPEGVTSIGDWAFYNCTILTRIIIPSSVTSIGDEAFYGCTDLRYYEYNNAYYLGNEDNNYVVLFKVKSTDISACDINSNTKFIYDYAFYKCEYIQTITIPSSVIKIGDYAFSGCDGWVETATPGSFVDRGGLENVTFEEGSQLKSIGSYAFSGCTDIKSITIPKNVTNIGDHAFDSTRLGSILIPQSVTSIGAYAFNSTNLTTVTFEGDSKLASIGERAFRYCYRLISIEIPSSVTSIGEFLFEGCTNLTTVTFEENSQGINIGTSAFEGCTSLATVTFEGNSQSICIGDSVFSGCTSLTEITIPSGVTSIGSYSFSSCTNLKSVEFEYKSQCESIGFGAFENCTSLTEISIPNSVTSIGRGAFEGCSGLRSIILPFVGETIDGTDDTHLGHIFGTGYADRNGDYVPSLLKTVIITSCNNIGYRAFYNCSGLTSITIPSSVIYIGDEAFLGCTGIESITIPSSVVSIGSYAFSGCTGIESITIPSSAESIGRGAFENCPLSRITLPFVGATLSGTENTHLGYIFGASSHSSNEEYIPTSLKSVVITGYTSIGSCAFYNCTNLTCIIMSEGITGIGNSAFYNCASLESVTIPSNVTSIGSDAFEGCTSLESIIIPSSVTSIGRYAFSGCTRLGSVKFEDESQCESIGYQAFYNCTRLESITIPSSVASIGASAFWCCKNLTTVTFEDPIGWRLETGTKLNVSDTAQNAIYLKETYIYQDWYTNHTGHSYVPAVTPPTCTEQGYTTHTCSCGDSYIDTYVHALDHDEITHSAQAATCTAIGWDAYVTCSRCDYSTYVEISPIPHTDGEWIIDIDSTCTQKGSKHQVCDICKATLKTDIIEIKEHTYENKVCTVCGNLEPSTGLTYILSTDGTYYTVSKGTCTDTDIVIASRHNGLPVTSIHYLGFYGCTDLTSIVIPNSVNLIGMGAFYGCTNLGSITIEGSPKIGDQAFDDTAYYNNEDNWQDGVLYIDNCLIKAKDTIETCIIKEGTTIIASSAFEGCNSLTNITIPNSVASIGSVFSGCISLRSITISRNVTSIVDWAFSDCSSLTIVAFEEGSQLTSIGYRAFQNCTSLESIIIPEGVTSIGYGAFEGCTSLTSVTFEDPNGWYVTETKESTKGTGLTLTDATKNATRLSYRYGYCYYYWYKR